jgi:hypothetical protein
VIIKKGKEKREIDHTIVVDLELDLFFLLAEDLTAL